ncbi:MAG: SHOCT domain-containing protein [Gemmatimonadaceae bacterium]|nr:SHOCT domain-containing protein [Gemmatimonadaceae bacterium]
MGRGPYDQVLNLHPRVTRSGLTVWLNAAATYLAIHDSPAGVVLDAGAIGAFFAVPRVELVNLHAAVALLPKTAIVVGAENDTVRLAENLWVTSHLFSDAPLLEIVERIRSVRPGAARPVSVAMAMAVYLAVIEQIEASPRPSVTHADDVHETTLTVRDVAAKLNQPSRKSVGAALQRLTAAGCLVAAHETGQQAMRVGLPRTPGAERPSATAAPVPSVSTTAPLDPLAQLERLFALFQEGAMPQAEYDAARRRLLAKL